MRTVVASVLGAILMYLWINAAYSLLPLGGMGVRDLPNEKAVLRALQTNLAENSGAYIFPRMKSDPRQSEAEKTAAMRNLSENVALYPSGMLIYHAAGSRPIEMSRWLTVEFATELIQALIAVFLLTCTRLEGFAGRVGFVMLVGLLVAIASNLPRWNWYGFPATYILAYMLIQFVGYLCVGLVAAVVFKGRSFGPVRKWSFLPAMSQTLPDR